MSMVVIRKAKRPVRPTSDIIAPTFGEPSTDVYRNVASITNRLVEAYGALVTPLDGGLDDELRRRDVDAITSGLDWVGFVQRANATITPIRHTLQSFGRLEVTPEEKRRPIRKDTATVTIPLTPKAMKRLFADIDQRAIDYAQVAAGRLIVHVSEETRASVRELVAKSMTGDLTVQQLARQLRAVLPLRPDQVSAVQKVIDVRRSDLEDAWRVAHDGVDAAGKDAADIIDAALKQGERAAVKKLAQRASLVARTEIVAASNRGRYLAWEAQIGGGYADTDSIKQWVAAGDACDECAAIDGEQVAWDDTFSSGDDMPPDHPACRCSAVLLPADAANGDIDRSGSASASSTADEVFGDATVGTPDGLEGALSGVLGAAVAADAAAALDTSAVATRDDATLDFGDDDEDETPAPAKRKPRR